MIHQSLQRIEKLLQTLSQISEAPSIGLTVKRLSSTQPGAEGQVVPGSMVLYDEQASEYFRGLGPNTMLPLSDLPPWTHMALAKGSWWLIQMG